MPGRRQALACRRADAFPTRLTPREGEVLRLVDRGLPDAEAAARLVVSPRTAHAHLAAVYGEPGVRSRAQAARWAHDPGFA